ncbi:cobyrinate a,c-diamide synthase [Tabrizicola sp.]|uniref:cobyrinate a,c-diamide synthase n=1 Tax=Tabrizicola sp. TaxID=2005166 RepID=UPI00261158BD|nr:cobyrinate a,c-diamide synthase [Tabrizicola sp.]MDM7931411.1 cobyrinate a,c-diamide synthase [Tabrizicola sp.]
MIPGLLVSAPASGTGKTTVMLGLLGALRDRGLKVQPFKNGPDYIDPAFHRAASGRESFNLDSWAMPGAMLDGMLAAAAGADLVLAEGSMGLFDGVALSGASGNGASADLAARMGWPVVLVIDASGQAQTAAAVALGLARFRPGVTVAGVILNRIASPRHEALVRKGMDEAGIMVLGVLPKRAAIAMPERHLGLVQAEEQPALQALIAEAAQLMRDGVDLDALIAAAATSATPTPAARITPPGQRIALARDAAFSFVYPHLLHGWRAAGAEVLPFSPLADQAPDPSADVCWLPGGYPELHAGALAAANRYRAGLRAFAETKPVHGECGGYMAMGAALIDKDGARHDMAGLLGLVTSYASRKMHLGYRMARLLHAIPGHATGAQLAGHEFHYSTILSQPDAPLAEVADATGAAVPETGSTRRQPGGGLSTGTYFHLIAGAE